MKFATEITNEPHLQALEIATAQFNEQQAAAAQHYNANLPKLFTGKGGAPLAHPDAKAPTAMTASAYLDLCVQQMLQALAVKFDTDHSSIDAEIEALNARKARAVEMHATAQKINAAK